MSHKQIRQVIEMAVENVHRGGGPFAALVVREGVVIASGCNQVTRTNDPTAHAEIVAIREACRVLGDYQLAGCEIYCSCEPCPMCLGAIYWARPARVYFAASQTAAAAAGFDDSRIYHELALEPAERSIPMTRTHDDQARRPFEAWINSADKKTY